MDSKFGPTAPIKLARWSERMVDDALFLEARYVRTDWR
jgi:hypothetical protein